MFKLHKLLILNHNLRINKANGKCKFKIICLFSVVYLNKTFYEFIILNKTKRKILPTHPGEMLKEDFIADYGLNATSLAVAVGVSRQTINEILRERRSITPEMALRFSRLFGNTPEFWLSAQHARDLWDSEQRILGELDQIEPLDAA